MLTIPLVLYGVARYSYLIFVKGEGGAPGRDLTKRPAVSSHTNHFRPHGRLYLIYSLSRRP